MWERRREIVGVFTESEREREIPPSESERVERTL